ncbi:MAG: exodeoxyribonuclease VII large subunit [Candidatus Puniceispirillaceae bacterium]
MCLYLQFSAHNDKIASNSVTENHNAPYISVGELSASVKRTLESAFDYVRIRGEISRPSFPGSGHIYFSLKDDSHNLGAVIWKGVASSIDVRPEEGLDVIATGKLTSFSGQSKYQLVVRSLEVAGEGALLKQLEERKKRLEAEGLFDISRKKPLPAFPKTIAIITSPTGAVIQDILHRLGDRFGVHVLVWPVLVQGKGSAEQVAAAIDGIDKIDGTGSLPRPDLMIVARGGGSLEDLMSFNEEEVIRAAARCRIPLISSIGHETDTTLLDYVADRRAPTPTAAAEIATPVKSEVTARIADWDMRQKAAMARRLQEATQNLSSALRGLSHPSDFVNAQSQALDVAHTKLIRQTDKHLYGATDKLNKLAMRLVPPHQLLGAMTRRYDGASQKLAPLMAGLLERKSAQFLQSDRLLEANSYSRVLDRGFALIRDESGDTIKQAKQLANGQMISITFADDMRRATIHDKSALSKKPSQTRKKSDDGQSELF